MAPNEDAVDKIKNAAKKEERPNNDATDLVKKIKAAKAPLTAAEAVGGLPSGGASKYFAFGDSKEIGVNEKSKKSKREESVDHSSLADKKKKKAKA